MRFSFSVPALLIILTTVFASNDKDVQKINAICTVEELHLKTELHADTFHAAYKRQDEDVADKETQLKTINEQYKLTCTTHSDQLRVSDHQFFTIHIRLAYYFCFETHILLTYDILKNQTGKKAALIFRIRSTRTS